MKRGLMVLSIVVLLLTLTACGPEVQDYKDELFIVANDGYGLVNHKNKEVIPLEYDAFHRCGTDFIGTKDNDLYYFNSEGETEFVLENAVFAIRSSYPVGCSTSIFDEDTLSLLPYESTITGLIGFVDNKGDEVVDDLYTTVIQLRNQDGYFVRNNDGWNVIMEDNGNLLMEDSFTNILQISDTLFAANKSDDYAIFNFDGDMLFDYDYDLPMGYSDQKYISLEKGYNEGIVDDQGNVILEFKYSTAKVLKNELFYVIENGVKKIVNIYGTRTIELEMDYISMINGTDFLEIVTSAGIGIYDYSGEEIITNVYDDFVLTYDYIIGLDIETNQSNIYDYEGELIIEIDGLVQYGIEDTLIFKSENGTFGLVNIKGDITLETSQFSITPYTLGVYKDKRFISKKYEESKCILIDESGKQKGAEYDLIFDFNSFGLAAVKDNDLMGYINMNGNVIIPLEYKYVETFIS